MSRRSLRPTATQAIGRGVRPGVLVGAGASAIVWLIGGIAAHASGNAVLTAAALAPVIVGGSVGAALGLAFGRGEGADIDDSGIRCVRGRDQAYASWPHIEDLRTERHGGRIHVALYLDDGRSVRLEAPYDGRFLAADPEFEHKLFMLRHLWETHRHAPEQDRDA